MKIGRNERCPCGSGKKYKHCCINATVDLQTPWGLGIQTITNEKRIDPRIGKVFYTLLDFLYQDKWTGACHGTSAILYVIYRELGFEPKLCTGIVYSDVLITAHSWIELDGEVYDAACYFPIEGKPKIMPVFNGVELGTMKTSCTAYGIKGSHFLSDDVQMMLDTDTTIPRVLNGEYKNEKSISLWNVLDNICLLVGIDNVIKVTDDAIDTNGLAEKYKDTHWTLCDQIPVPTSQK